MKKGLKLFFRLALIILGSLILVIAWNNKDNLSSGNIIYFVQDYVAGLLKGRGYPVEIIGGKVSRSNFKVLGKDIVAVSDVSFFCFNKTGKEISIKQHSLRNPILKCSANSSLIYDLYGMDYKVEGKSTTFVKDRCDNVIISGAIANNGVYGLVTESSEYLCELDVYSQNGKEKYYNFCFSEYYVSALDFSSSGKNVAAIGHTAENGEIKSVLYVFDYERSEPKCKIEYLNEMLIDVFYLSSGNIMVVGESLFSLVNPLTNERRDISYGGMTLASFEVNKRDGAVFALSMSNDGALCKVKCFNISCDQLCEIKFDDKVTDVSIKSGNMMILSYDNIFKYNMKGEKLSQTTVKNDSREIVMFSSRSAYVLGVNEIYHVDF